jgi:hypothetical protein
MHIQIFRLYLTNLQKCLKNTLFLLQGQSKNNVGNNKASLQGGKSIFVPKHFRRLVPNLFYVHCAHSCKVTAPMDKNSENHSKICTTSKKDSGHPQLFFVQDPARNYA